MNDKVTNVFLQRSCSSRSAVSGRNKHEGPNPKGAFLPQYSQGGLAFHPQGKCVYEFFQVDL